MNMNIRNYESKDIEEYKGIDNGMFDKELKIKNDLDYISCWGFNR